MFCYQCDHDGLYLKRGPASMPIRVICPNCNMKISPQDLVVVTGEGFRYERDLQLSFYDTDVNVANLSFSLLRDRRLKVIMNTPHPSRAIRLISFLSEIFGENVVFKVNQNGRDDHYKGCPICGQRDFEWQGKHSWMLSCRDHYEVHALDLAESLAASLTSKHARTQNVEKFFVDHSYLVPPYTGSGSLQYATIAEVELRKGRDHGVLAVRALQQDFEEEFATVLAALQTINMPDFKVMRVK